MTRDDLVLREDWTIEPDARAVLLTLNRQADLNAISWEMLHALDEAIDEIIDEPIVRAVFITGAGRAFCAGGDLKKYIALQRDPREFPQFVDDLHRIFGRLRTLDVPVIALVNGVAAAGGLELILNCDFAIASADARIGDAHLNFGQMGGGGVLSLLPRLVGIQRAADLIFSGRLLSATEALEWALVSRVVDAEALLSEGRELARQYAIKSRLALANAKYVMNAVWSESLSVTASLRLERERNALYCLTSSDAPEGLDAFQSKRQPRFAGR